MEPVKTTETDQNFAPPPGQEDTIGDLPCHFELEGWGQMVYSVWEPTDEERQAIANGQNLRVGVGYLGGMPPISLGITHLARVE